MKSIVVIVLKDETAREKKYNFHPRLSLINQIAFWTAQI